MIGGESKTIPIPLTLIAKETFSIEVKVAFESNEQIYEVEDSPIMTKLTQGIFTH